MSAAAPLATFLDGGDVSDYAQAAMRCAVAKGIITGTDDGSLDPVGHATRAQVAAIMQRFVSKA